MTQVTDRAQQRLLLTSVCRPFGGPGEGDSVGAELFHAQITRAQGPFSLRQVIRVWAIDYLAENLATPTVTLHYPSEAELSAELKAHRYTHVGINFVVATFHKVIRMSRLIREHAPEAKIVLGGYGTVLPDEVLRPHCDAICREEGVGFMRRLLGEPVDAPVTHPHAPIPATRVLGYQRPTVVGHVTAGLGCTNGCDFCCTSHFFKQKYVPYAKSGRDIFDALLRTRAHALADGVPMKGFIIIDEDFFLHRRRALEFLDCARENGEALSLMGFGSVRGLSQFTAKEIAEMGFDLVWNAFEGRESGYAKQKGRPLSELYAGLKAVGCAQLTSMIIGFPYQDEATIWSEFEALMALEPALTQCLIYFAFPTTPFHAQVVREKRYLPRYEEQPDLRRWDGFSMHFKHPKIAQPERVEAIQRQIYQQDFERLGPSVMRLGRVWLTGYKNLRDDPNPLLRARAERQRNDVRGILPALSAITICGPSAAVRARAIALRADIIRLTGALSLKERGMEAAAPLLYLLSRAAELAGVRQQPSLLRTEHRTGTATGLHTRDALSLQGNLAASAVETLVEELRDRLRRRFDRAFALGRSAIADESRAITQRSYELPDSVAAR
jgi:hypothetical protein